MPLYPDVNSKSKDSSDSQQPDPLAVQVTHITMQPGTSSSMLVNVREFTVPQAIQGDLYQFVLQQSQSLQQQGNALIAKAQALEDDYTNNYPIYLGQLAKLKNFQQQHCQDHPELLTHFYTPKAYIAMNDEYKDTFNESWKNEFHGLFSSLANLSDAIPQDRTSPHYAPLRQALLNAILLTEKFTQEINSKNASQTRIQLVKKKIVALAENIQAAFDFSANPDANSQRLYTATETMNNTIDPDAFFHEHRLFLGISAAMGTLLGLALIMNCCLNPVCAPFFVPMFISGLLLFTASAASLATTISKPYNDQHPLARDINAPLKSISTNPNSGFFSSRSAAGQPAVSTQHAGNTGHGLMVSSNHFTYT